MNDINDMESDFLSHKIIETLTFVSILLEYFKQNNIESNYKNIKLYIRKVAKEEVYLSNFTINGIHTSNCKKIAEGIMMCSKNVREKKESADKIRAEIKQN